MGLTNIAGMSESARKRIKEKGLPLIEHCMFEHHDLIRRAAIQVRERERENMYPDIFFSISD